jgi:hypothetical protein
MAEEELAEEELAEEELAESDIELLPGEKKPQSSQAWMIA